jgi:hypothetical protein
MKRGPREAGLGIGPKSLRDSFSLMRCERCVLDAIMGRGGRGVASRVREARQRLTGGAEVGMLGCWQQRAGQDLWKVSALAGGGG